jgi:hypothetical protein
LAAEGIEVVQGDLDDKQSLVEAFQGATAIFSNTDFFVHLFHGLDPANLPEGRTALEYAYDREVAQGMNIAEAAESPSVLSTLERFVYSSLCDSSRLSGRKYTLYHFDSKIETLRLTRERCPGVASKMSTLIAGHYVTNWKMFAKLAPQKQPDGSYLLCRDTPSTFQMPHFVAHRDTGPFVKALVDMAPGKEIFAVSQYTTLPEMVEVWGRIHNVKAGYKEISTAELFQGLPEAFAYEMGESFDFLHKFGFTGGDPQVLQPDQVSSMPDITRIYLLTITSSKSTSR